jgi:NADH-quinone oxidoreductase subunit C
MACVAEMDDLAAAAAGLPGVERAGLEGGELVLHAQVRDLAALMPALRDDPRFACEQLMDLCGVDWPERDPRFDLVYNLLSVRLNHRVRVIAGVAEGQAALSVHQVWPVATWFEREAWDLYGIPFDGQPDLRRILTDYGFSGHPLRKDFPLTGFVECRWDDERKQVIYEPVTLTQDFRNFDFVSPWEGMVTLPGDEKAHSGSGTQKGPPDA